MTTLPSVLRSVARTLLAGVTGPQFLTGETLPSD